MERDSLFFGLGGRDAYEILGISAVATTSEIRAARRELQKAVHPDRHGDAELSKLVNYAAQILLNDSSRRSYDEFRNRHRSATAGHRATTAQPAWAPPPPAYDEVGPRGYAGRVILGLLLLVMLAVCVGTGVLDTVIERLTDLTH